MLNIIVSLITLSVVHAAPTPSRVVSLSPAHTQTLIDLGLEDKIACVAQPFDTAKIKHKINSVGFYHKPSIELIISCKPDLIITTYAGTPPELYNKLKEAGYNILVDKPKDLNSIKNFILKLTNLFKIQEPKIIKSFDSICTKDSKLNGIMIIGFDPLIVVGKDSFVSDALHCAGINNPVNGLYPRLNIESVLSYKKDVVVVAVKDFERFKDYKLISNSFKGKVIYIDPDKILLPSTGIIKGIMELKKLIKD